MLLVAGIVFLLSSGSVASKHGLKPVLSFEYGNSKIYVFDGVLPNRLVELFSDYVNSKYHWSFTYPDAYEGQSDIPNSGNIYWRTRLSPSQFIKNRVWGYLRSLYKSLPRDLHGEEKFLPYDVQGTMIHRGEVPVTFTGDVNSTNKIFMRIFLTPHLNRHSYSDQAFYDRDGEIVASVYPKFGRVIVWTGDVETLMRPPSMGVHFAERSLVVKLSSCMDDFRLGNSLYTRMAEESEARSKAPFPFTNEADLIADDLDVSKHVVRVFHDQKGNKGAIFDGAFPKEIVDATRKYMVNYGASFSYQSYDPASSETHDNVNWIAGFPPDAVLPTVYWKVIRKMAHYLSNETGWHPYDVSCNLLQHWHHTRIHEDCVSQEYEFTYLMYLNPNWTENLYAETSFYQLTDKSLSQKDWDMMRRGSEEYDLIGAAIPKFGRVVMFRNLIPHSARPPSPDFRGARYTFPVKVSRTRQLARAKVLREALDYKSEDMPDLPEYGELREGNYAPYLSDEQQAWVEQEIKKMLDAKSSTIDSRTKQLEQLLYPSLHLKESSDV